MRFQRLETPLTAGSVARSVAIALADLFWGLVF